MNALALEVEEGRGKLRKASGRRKQPMIRRYPNGATHPGKPGMPCAESIGAVATTQGSETSQYLEEKKAIAIPLVAASEEGTGQTGLLVGPGLRAAIWRRQASRTVLEQRAGEGESPVSEAENSLAVPE